MGNPDTKRFGRYEILGELGRGAMGVVYKARDPQIDRLVALKTISLRGQDEDAEKEFRMRFQNEAQAAGRLHHPGIVAVFDVGEDAETHDPYIVLEYVAGEALNRILAREKKLALERALQLTEDIAAALDYAHAQGVTHRDIKPGNILISQDGRPKVADFGIAKLNLAHLTIPGKLLGTPAYMAPEQLAGKAADGRSDLFSLGVILYAMVTGHSPFQGDSATTVCFKVANREPVPASALNLDLPRELDAVIARAMAKDSKRRYQRGAEFAEAVAEVRTSLTPDTGTRTGTHTVAPARALSGGPAVGLAYAAKLVRAAVLKAPVRDIVLGLATIILLLIVGVQTKLLVFTHEEAAATTAATAVIPAHTDSSPGGAGTPGPATASAANPAAGASNARASTATSASKASAKSVRTSTLHPAREIVVPLSTVELAVRHQFKDATLSVWVDGKLALTRPLHGGTQKRLVVFNGVRGNDSETLQVPAGKHVLRFRAETADQTINLSKTISADLIGGGDKTLAVTFDKHNTAMFLQWQ
jgi:eukaryotic-like serine/threonine-protein kinase